MNNPKVKEENLRKNKPNKIIPIINTIFACILLIGTIYLKIRWGKEFHIVYFILMLVLIVLFPIGSWYNSYFSKIQNTKRIYNYDKETKEIVAYIKRLQSYQGIELNRELQLEWSYEWTDQIIDKVPQYNEEHFSFGLANENAIILTVGVSFAGLEFKGYNQELVGICGVMPKSVWYKKRLKAPIAKKGKIKIQAIGFELTQKTVIQALKNQDVYYDNRSGWLVAGERKPTILDEAIEVMNDVIVVIRNNELVALWIKVKPGLAI